MDLQNSRLSRSDRREVVRCFPFPDGVAASLACRLWRRRVRVRWRGSSTEPRRVVTEVAGVAMAWSGVEYRLWVVRRVFEWH